MKNVLFLLIGWLNHISATLIMSQGVGMSSENKQALELRTHELEKAIENAQQSFAPDGFTAEQIATIRRIASDIMSGGGE